ncbi:unnamed protein product [Cylindrotheca closterium]|uniref:Uncharacterized protein n=1 Tax=Cylindrotheca closterium TaxID=2856 RepID=A0AAD2FTX1_9STRA|nr:unnamed protein product [Cylindrotheca closterium]
MPSLFRICNVFGAVPDCGDQWNIVKGAFHHIKGSSKHDDDNMTVNTEASEDPINDKIESAVLIQAHVRGMMTRLTILKRLKMEKRARIEANLEEIHEILKTNKQLYNRCKPNIRGGRGLPRTVITRIGFVSVLATTRNNSLRLTTRAERQYQSFDTRCMSELPKKIDGIFEVDRGDQGFIDYSALLEKLLLFHDDILELILELFKTQLQSVTETLAEIYEWIHEVNTHTEYLQDTFDLGDELELPEECQLGATSGSSASLVQTLKVINFDRSMRMTAAFDIQQERDQNRLHEFLKFLQEDQTP